MRFWVGAEHCRGTGGAWKIKCERGRWPLARLPLLEPSAFELAGAQQDGGFEIVLDLSGDRGGSPLAGRGADLPIHRYRERIGAERVRKDEYIYLESLIGFILRRIPITDQQTRQRVLRAELDEVQGVVRRLPQDRADRASGLRSWFTLRCLPGKTKHSPQRSIRVVHRVGRRRGG